MKLNRIQGTCYMNFRARVQLTVAELTSHPPPHGLPHQEAAKALASALGRRGQTPHQDRPRVQETPIQRVCQPPSHQCRQPEHNGKAHTREYTVL